MPESKEPRKILLRFPLPSRLPPSLREKIKRNQQARKATRTRWSLGIMLEDKPSPFEEK